MQSAKDLDGKAGNLIGYVTIVTGLIIGLGTFSILEKLSQPQYYVPYFIGIAALLASIIISLLAIRIRSWYSTPVIEDLEDYLKDNNMDYKSVVIQVALPMIYALKQNFTINQCKARLIYWSWMCLVIGIALLVIYAGIFIYTSIYTPEKTKIEITLNGNSTTIKQILGQLFQTSMK